ncbi:Uncharacterised protein [Vibrio cholerae]|nr:Uncharacterised protein [Vibrio cholerae]
MISRLASCSIRSQASTRDKFWYKYGCTSLSTWIAF